MYPMNKSEAERILGLSRVYMYKDVVKAYRTKIKAAHPDVGGSIEAATQLNAAKEFMDELFAGDKTVVFSAESNKSCKESKYEAQRGESSTSPKQQSSADRQGSSNQRKASNQQKESYVAWWEVAYGKNNKRSAVIANGKKGIDDMPDGPLPWWYQFADFMVRRFPWKTSLVLVFLIYLLFFIPYAMGGCTPLAVVMLYALFGAAIVNAITGCFTDSFRKAIRFHADTALFRWQAKEEG